MPTIPKIIVIANQKGGVGKTTTAINLTAGLARNGHPALLVDIDPQCNATSGVGFTQSSPTTSYDLFLQDHGASSLQLPATPWPAFHLLPGSPDLASVGLELSSKPDRIYRLRAGLSHLPAGLEYVLLDCPPSLGILTVNALVAAHSVLIPLQCEYYALEGLSRLIDTIRKVQQAANPSLTIEGLLLTMYDGRTRLSSEVRKEVVTHFGQAVYDAYISRNVRLSEAPSYGQPIFEYDPECVGAQQYDALCQEFLARNSHEEQGAPSHEQEQGS